MLKRRKPLGRKTSIRSSGQRDARTPSASAFLRRSGFAPRASAIAASKKSASLNSRVVGRHTRRGNSSRAGRGETTAEARKRKKLAHVRTRQALVFYVRNRDEHHCRLCGRSVQYHVDSLDSFGEVHEYVWRSRGGSDIEPTNCVLVCKGCHTMHEPCIHPSIGHRSARVIVPLDADKLMEGPIMYRVENFDGEPEPEPDSDVDDVKDVA